MRSSGARRTGPRRTAVRTAAALLALAAATVLAGCASASTTSSTTSPGGSAFKPVTQKTGSQITVWADSTRLPAVQAYQKSHPDVKMNIVTYDGSADGSTYLQTKVQLFDRTGSGWPDVVFGSPTDVTWASAPTTSGATPFAAPLDQSLVPQSTLDGFAKGSLTPCQFNGHTYCLRNDIAQVVLWYNKTLMDQWGYQAPTTWDQYQALGLKVAKDHPGYLVGSVGDTNSQESYFWSAQCPAFHLVSPTTLKVALQDPQCTRMAGLLDKLIAAKAVTTQGFFSQGFAKNSGSKVLMAVGPSWYGQYLFKTAFNTPAKQISAAAPLTWPGETAPATGNVGGGVWMVSGHSANLKASTDLVTWLTTSNANQASAPTYPAYVPAATAWLANPANRDYFATDVSGPFQQAAGEVWSGWSNTKFSDATAWSSVVLPALTAGKTLTQTLPAWQQAISNQAKTDGYQVVNQ
jgi:ABC-type glycerol-3-phosphate transport system substrate-binding protein